VGALIGGGVDLAFQLIANGGNLSCVNWGDVATSAALGAVGGGLSGKAFNTYKKYKVQKDVGKEIGILRDALKGKGNFGLGSATRAEANRLGRSWVGDGAKLTSDGKILISKDGLRQFRLPSFKKRLGKTQANFERRFSGQKTKQWQANGHLDILD